MCIFMHVIGFYYKKKSVCTAATYTSLFSHKQILWSDICEGRLATVLDLFSTTLKKEKLKML